MRGLSRMAFADVGSRHHHPQRRAGRIALGHDQVDVKPAPLVGDPHPQLMSVVGFGRARWRFGRQRLAQRASVIGVDHVQPSAQARCLAAIHVIHQMAPARVRKCQIGADRPIGYTQVRAFQGQRPTLFEPGQLGQVGVGQQHQPGQAQAIGPQRRQATVCRVADKRTPSQCSGAEHA